MLNEKLQALKATLETCSPEERSIIESDIKRIRLAIFHEGELSQLVQFCSGVVPSDRTYPDDEQQRFEMTQVEARSHAIETEGRQLPQGKTPRVDPEFENKSEEWWAKYREKQSEVEKQPVEAPRLNVYPQPLPDPLPKSEAQLEANRVLACKNEAKRIHALQEQAVTPTK